ncbi:carbohydrate kinase family protein, partial [Lutibacter sp.]|uniref:carbohydrate kinase family protein n=1 Tax=Lutibacter sp. TaxID=1925666 RepID=UPI0034A086FB
DDMLRLFEKKLSHEDIFNFFHSEGVDTVCLTLGSKGVILSEKGKKAIQLPAIKIDVVQDATGAGDAFWSGFLFAYIKNKPIEKCLEVALQLAALKLQNVGRLPDNINILSELL